MIVKDIPVARIFLDLENPRFPEWKVESESDAIAALCQEEYVLNLAEDIVRHGLNPLETFAITKDQKPSMGATDRTYIALEGNRRLCALKLLADPNFAPKKDTDKFAKRFARLREGWDGLDSIPCVVFDDRESAKIWLERQHGGFQNGIGRRPWDAEQKQRFSPEGKNARALALLDYAEEKDMIRPGERKGTPLTTVQRFLSNPLLRDALGIEYTKEIELLSTRPQQDFDARVRQFIADSIEGKRVHSRAKKHDIVEYLRGLDNRVPVTGNRSDGKQPISPNGSQKEVIASRKGNKGPRKPTKIRNVVYNEGVVNLLDKIQNEKLQSLYFGICRVDLTDHLVPLVTVGCWVFLECLSAANDRQKSVSFPSYFSNQKIKELVKRENNVDVNSIRTALDDLGRRGNATKHDFIYASFNGLQLANEMKTLEPLVLATCQEIIKKQSSSLGHGSLEKI